MDTIKTMIHVIILAAATALTGCSTDEFSGNSFGGGLERTRKTPQTIDPKSDGDTADGKKGRRDGRGNHDEDGDVDGGNTDGADGEGGDDENRDDENGKLSDEGDEGDDEGLDMDEDEDSLSLVSTRFSVHTNCSDENGVEQVGSSIVSAAEIHARLYPVSGGQPIELSNEEIRDAIMSDLTFEIRLKAPDGRYNLVLCDESQGSGCHFTVAPSESGDGDDIESFFEENGRGMRALGVSYDAFEIRGGEIVGGAPEIWAVLDGVRDDFGEEQCTGNNSSPLIVDLAADGIRLSAQSKGVDFDIEARGAAHRISWTMESDDRFLALDRNGNGMIDDGSELFGNNTLGLGGKKAANGFAALSALDDDRNGKIDAADKSFHALVLWQDKNRDGRSQAGELEPAAKHLAEIGLAYDVRGLSDAFGNLYREHGTVKLVSGQSRPVVDVWFRLGQSLAGR